MADYPTLTRQIDTNNFAETQADPTLRKEAENGIKLTRPRYTRIPSKSFKFSLVDMPDADKVTLSAFFETMKGGSNSFNWTHPVTVAVHIVRFSGTIEFKISGPGTSHRWDATGIELEEV